MVRGLVRGGEVFANALGSLLGGCGARFSAFDDERQVDEFIPLLLRRKFPVSDHITEGMRRGGTARQITYRILCAVAHFAKGGLNDSWLVRNGTIWSHEAHHFPKQNTLWRLIDLVGAARAEARCSGQQGLRGARGRGRGRKCDSLERRINPLGRMLFMVGIDAQIFVSRKRRKGEERKSNKQRMGARKRASGPRGV